MNTDIRKGETIRLENLLSCLVKELKFEYGRIAHTPQFETVADCDEVPAVEYLGIGDSGSVVVTFNTDVMGFLLCTDNGGSHTRNHKFTRDINEVKGFIETHVYKW